MRYVDPETGKQVWKSTGTNKKREADKAAGKLQAELREGRYATDSRMAWEDFLDRYDAEKLASLADAAVSARHTG